MFFVHCNIVAVHTHTGHTGFTSTLSFPAAFLWSFSLVETTYLIVNMIQVIKKEPRATKWKSFSFFMVKFWQVSNITLKSNYRRCSIKEAVPKHFAKLIGKHLCWSLFSINLQTYKPATLLGKDSNTGVFLWIFRNC